MLAVLHLVLMLAVPLAVVAALAAVFRARGEKRLRAAAAAESARAGEVEVRGKLTLVGAPIRVEPDGGSVVARTTWSYSWRDQVDRSQAVGKLSDRATVMIETDDGVVALDGEVDVASGSRATWDVGRRDPATRYFDVTMHLVAGDRVRAFGKLKDDDGPAPEGYRGEGRRRLIVPSGAPVRLVAEGAPAVRRHGDFRRWPVLIVAAPFFALPYGAVRDFHKAEQVVDTSCKVDGRCHAVPSWRIARLADVLRGWWNGDHFAVRATSDADCKKTPSCVLYGACTVVDGRCVPHTDADCLQSFGCARDGRCQAKNDECLTRDEDCARGEYCQGIGACSADGYGCKAKSDADCRQGQYCLGLGFCSAVAGSCVAATDADCADSYPCHSLGECVAKDGACVKPSEAVDGDCAEECAANGYCTLEGGTCVATTDEQCRASQACATEGRCHAKAKKCVRGETELRCRDTEACRTWGRCGDESGGDCIAASAKDCQAARACKEKGACTLADGACIQSCAALPACKNSGRCELVDGRCTVTAAGCKASNDCWMSGQCSPKNGSCAALSDADCKGSYYCKEIANCRLGSNGYCDSVGEGHKDCTLPCKLRGQCTQGDYACIVGGDADCQKSDVCAKYGWCTAAKMPERYYPTSARVCFSTAELPAVGP